MERNQKNKEKGNGQGTIYKSSKTGLYVGQYVYNGKRKSVYQRKNEKITDFKSRFNKILVDISSGTHIENSNETFISILKNLVEQKHKDGLTSDRSYARELETIKQIEKTCENFINKPIQKITSDDIEKSKENIRSYSNNVIEKIWILIKRTFKVAVSRRKIIFNPMDDETLIRPISNQKREAIQALTVDEEEKFKQILQGKEKDHPFSNILMLQLKTGMRIGEVLALSKDCIDLKSNTLTVYRTLTQNENYQTILGEHTKTYVKKTGIDKGKRTFCMTSEVKVIIRTLLKSNMFNIYNLLFWDYQNNTFITPTSVNSYLYRINKKYKISNRLHTHKLRHTFITRCREAGMDLSVIQKIVGHVEGSSITSDVYTSVSFDFMQQELKKIK